MAVRDVKLQDLINQSQIGKRSVGVLAREANVHKVWPSLAQAINRLWANRWIQKLQQVHEVSGRAVDGATVFAFAERGLAKERLKVRHLLNIVRHCGDDFWRYVVHCLRDIGEDACRSFTQVLRSGVVAASLHLTIQFRFEPLDKRRLRECDERVSGA